MEKTIYTKSHKYLVKQLIRARKEAGLRQEDVAKKLARIQSYVSKIEAGHCRIDVIQLKELTGIYKKRLDYFIK